MQPPLNPVIQEQATEVVLVLTTEADPERAEQLARTLLERRLVACVSLVPLRSIYRWQGQLAQAEEVQLLLKTSPAQLEALERVVRELHSYDTPEWLHWQAIAGGAYGGWLAASAAAGVAVAAELSPGGSPPAPEARPAGGDPAG